MVTAAEQQRCTIAAVKLRAFKNAGTGKEVAFSGGLNVIVGPNGCGKSSLLDAICFALGAPARALGVAHLRELQNTECKEVCEVTVELECRRGKGSISRHRVTAALTPDGGRAFKLNGKNATGRQVKEFARGVGIALDSAAAVVRQAGVTQLADSNDAGALVALVAAASGAGRWDEEAKAATEEVRRIREALLLVQADVQKLERAVGHDLETLAAHKQKEAAEQEAADAEAQLAQAYGAALARCDAEDAEEAAAQADLRQALAAASEREAGERARHAGAEAELQALATPDPDALLRLQLRVATAEAEVRLAEEQAAARSQAEQDLGRRRALAEEARGAHSRGLAALASLQQAARRAASDVELAQQLGGGEGVVAGLRLVVKGLEEEATAQRLALSSAAQQAEACAARLAELHGVQSELRAALAEAEERRGRLQQKQASTGLQPGEVAARLTALRQRHKQLAAREQRAAAQLSMASPGRGRPLHSCFSFHDPAACQQYAPALNALAGRHLDVLVTESPAEAERLLDSDAVPPGVRIWVRQGLVAADATAVQRRAASCFAPGQVLLPLDLLCFEPGDRPAILRAFGGCVIAADESVAEALLSQHNLRSITLDGTVHSRGSLQGGWRGGSAGQPAGGMASKLELDAARAERVAAELEAEQVAATLSALEADAAAEEEAHEAVTQASEELAGMAREAEACTRQAAALAQERATTEAALQRIAADLHAKQGILGGTTGAGEGRPPVEALQRDAARLRSEAREAEAQVHALAAAAAAAGAAVLEVEEARGRCSAASASCLDEERAAQVRAELGAARSALAEEHAAAASRASGAQLLREAAAEKLAAAEAAAREAEGLGLRLAEGASGSRQRERARAEVGAQLAALLKESPHLQQAAGEASPSPACSPAEGLDGMVRACARLARQLAQAQAAQRRGRALPPLLLPDRLRMEGREATLGTLREHSATLASAAAQLEAGIEMCSPQVVAANEAAFAGMADAFARLASQALPAHQARLVKLGRQVGDGLQLQYRHAPGGDEAWHAGLDALSGGQRTLVSLALVAAASASGGGAAVLLVDECDAALDESNQAQAAALLRGLLASQCGCAQVLSVSHNPAFQAAAARIVRLAAAAGATAAA